MAAHTPGPWEVAGNCVRTQYRMGDPDNNGTMVADVGVYLPEREANARLIAAAPELLDALTDLFDYVVANGILKERSSRLAKARAALAKAAPSTSDGEG